MTGIQLRELLERNGISQRRFCRLVQADPSTMARRLAGTLGVPRDWAVLLSVIDQTDLTIDDVEQLAQQVAP